MKQNERPNLQQMLSNKKTLQKVAQSQEAQQLAGMLTRDRDPADLQKIAEKAARGDTSELNQLIRSIASSPGGAQLLQKLNEAIEK